ncbi:MAG TPA: GFA family protein [Nevskiaceae bacterium]|nr:GFA family protein [Nevskiaceae bacterium]
MHKGSCLCGGVRFQIDAPLNEIGMCHCAMCRKASGTAFATNAPVPEDKLRISGAELLSSYESSPGKQRVFCSRCGSPIYSRSAKRPGVVRIRVGTLDTPVGRVPDYHFWVQDKADWYEIRDGLPQHRGVVPNR